jgi:hypothetical protein
VSGGKKLLLSFIAAAAIVGGAVLWSSMCVSAWMEHGIVLGQCPDGKMVPGLSVSASSLRRGDEGAVHMSPIAYWTSGPADQMRTVSLPDMEAQLFLVPDGGEEQALTPKEGWKKNGGSVTGKITLPADLKDGDHKLRAKARTSAGEVSLDVPFSVYAPAKVHLLTDRPLYEPGNTIRFRAVVLRARDLVPLEARPGVWKVFDAAGQLVLEERARTSPFGVVSSELALDDEAPQGSWRVEYSTGGTTQQRAVTVEPFTLPRFTVEVKTPKPFYGAGDKPVLTGKVRYASGAPVDADLEISWRAVGAWPMPTSWMAEALPRTAKTDAAGTFELDLPEVPEDLRGQVRLLASVSATDPSKDRVTAGGAVLLSEDKISVESFTELGNGLVEKFNNRVFLRVASASGATLANTDLVVKKAWEPDDEGIKTRTDADGVAVLQLDPGPAVNVIVPPMPVRRAPKQAAIERISARELIKGGSPRLKDITVMDRWNGQLARCERYVQTEATTQVALRVAETGEIEDAVGNDRLGRCVASALEDNELPKGPPRILQLGYRLTSDMPTWHRDDTGTVALPAPIAKDIDAGLQDARTCALSVGRTQRATKMLMWTAYGRLFSADFTDDDKARGSTTSSAVMACLESKLLRRVRQRTLPESFASGPKGFGVTRFRVSPGARDEEEREPEATTRLGYELLVQAKGAEEDMGETKVFFSRGNVPPVRFRADPVIAEAGGKVSVKILRGPSFRGELPKKLSLVHEQKSVEADVDEESRTVTFELPKDLSGWFHVSWSSATTRIYVRPPGELEVSVKPDRAVFAPGETAVLAIETRAQKGAVPAAVSLIGVDAMLAELVPLPQTDDMSKELLPPVTSVAPFEGMDAQALIAGRVRGKNAAEAVVLRVTGVPSKAEMDVYVDVSGRTELDVIAPLTDRFYTLLGDVHGAVRSWEESAGEKDKMTPPRMFKIWQSTVSAAQKKGTDVSDAFGRPVQLRSLPDDLLALVDPRSVIVEGTHLPEDIEPWIPWVREHAR